MAVNYTSARFSAEDDNGRPLVGGRLFTYQNGTNTPAVTYKDAAGTTPNLNPIILDARGEAVVHLDPAQVYRFVLQNRVGSLLWSQDGITGVTSTIEFAQFQGVFNGYKADLAGAGGAELVGYRLSATGAQPRSLDAYLADLPISVKEFGAAGDDATDDSVAFQNWMTYIHDNQVSGYVPPGTYRINTQTVKPASAFCPVIFGAGSRATILKGPGNTAVWKILGGSGTPSAGSISDICFDGNSPDTGFCIEIADQCGLPVHRCSFYNARYAGVLHNLTGFTEYVTFENCEFGPDVRTDLKFIRTTGADSFHGSGIRAGSSNESQTANTAKIEIGGPLTDKGVALTVNNNIIVYNSILEMQLWKWTGIPFIYNYSTRPSANFHGNMTFEIFGAIPFKFAETAPGIVNTVYFNGDIAELNNYVRRGDMKPYLHLAFAPDSSPRAFLKPYQEPVKGIGGGASIVTYLTSTGGETYHVEVILTGVPGNAPLYIQSWSLICHMEPGLNGQVTATRNFVRNGGDLGADPVFTMDSVGNLFVTLPGAVPALGVAVRSTITQMAWPSGAVW